MGHFRWVVVEHTFLLWNRYLPPDETWSALGDRIDMASAVVHRLFSF